MVMLSTGLVCVDSNTVPVLLTFLVWFFWWLDWKGKKSGNESSCWTEEGAGVKEAKVKAEEGAGVEATDVTAEEGAEVEVNAARVKAEEGAEVEATDDKIVSWSTFILLWDTSLVLQSTIIWCFWVLLKADIFFDDFEELEFEKDLDRTSLL